MPEDLVVSGPTLSLRYATAADGPRLFELASDPEVTRFFSWGPYTEPAQALAYIDSLPGKRQRGELLDFLVVHHEDGPIGVTGLSELARRDRHAALGAWYGRQWWGSGAISESTALIAHLGFATCGFDRINAWANTRNQRSQAAIERLGFRREGVLRAWHRHGEQLHDVVANGLLRSEWERSPLREVPVEVSGAPPQPWLVG